MKFSDLYACSKCSRVYAAEVNNGVCREIVDVGRSNLFGDIAMMCGGVIRPINYKPPTKDPRQRDIEEDVLPGNV